MNRLILTTAQINAYQDYLMSETLYNDMYAFTDNPPITLEEYEQELKSYAIGDSKHYSHTLVEYILKLGHVDGLTMQKVSMHDTTIVYPKDMANAINDAFVGYVEGDPFIDLDVNTLHGPIPVRIIMDYQENFETRSAIFTSLYKPHRTKYYIDHLLYNYIATLEGRQYTEGHTYVIATSRVTKDNFLNEVVIDKNFSIHEEFYAYKADSGLELFDMLREYIQFQYSEIQANGN